MTPARFPLAPQPRGRTPVASTVDVPLTLELGAESVSVIGRLEPMAAVSVIPHGVGLRLGATWTGHTVPIAVPGRRTAVLAAPLTVRGTVAPFPPVILFFAWADTDKVPLVLGQTNFFQQYDICFHLARSHVEVRPAALPRS